MAQRGKPSGWARPLLAVGSLALGILVCDQLLAPRLLPPPGFYVKPPNQVWIAELGEGVIPGVNGTAVCRFTADGIRADPFDAADRYRILCIGGSTTECAVLDTDEAWPHHLQDRLRTTAPGLHAWVGNAGGSGLSTRQHLLIQELVVPRLPNCDAVIHLAGVNDFMLRIATDDAFEPLTPEQILADGACRDRAFTVHPSRGYDLPWYKKTNLWLVARQVKRRWERRGQAPELAKVTRYDYEGQLARLQELRRTRMTARTRLPDLTSSLAEYERNLRYLVEQTRRQGVRLIFLTQPTLWRADLNEQERYHLTFAQVGRDPYQATEYYAPGTLAEGIVRYNQVMRRVAADTQTECLDLATLIPKDFSSFYDDCHFNEPGAVKVADALAEYLASRPPFDASEPAAGKPVAKAPQR